MPVNLDELENEVNCLSLYRRLQAILDRFSLATSSLSRFRSLFHGLPELIAVHATFLPSDGPAREELCRRLEFLRSIIDEADPMAERARLACAPLFEAVDRLALGGQSADALAALTREVDAPRAEMDQFCAFVESATLRDGSLHSNELPAVTTSMEEARGIFLKGARSIRRVRQAFVEFVQAHRNLTRIAYGYDIQDSEGDYLFGSRDGDVPDEFLGPHLADPVTAYQLQLARFATENPAVLATDAHDVQQMREGRSSLDEPKIAVQRLHQAMIDVSMPAVRLGNSWRWLSQVVSLTDTAREMALATIIADKMADRIEQLVSRASQGSR